MFTFTALKYRDIINLCGGPEAGFSREKITALVGTSGSGKTTMLRLMDKLISPTEGKILFDGEDIATMDSVSYRRRVSMLSQSTVVFPGTVRDNLLIALKLQGKSFPDDRELKCWMDRMSLGKQLDSDAAGLSGGERQRLAAIRILLLDSECYLMDEPTSALDKSLAVQMIRETTDFIREKAKTLIIVTHDPGIAFEFSDVTVQMESGRFVGRESIVRASV